MSTAIGFSVTENTHIYSDSLMVVWLGAGPRKVTNQKQEEMCVNSVVKKKKKPARATPPAPTRITPSAKAEDFS